MALFRSRVDADQEKQRVFAPFEVNQVRITVSPHVSVVLVQLKRPFIAVGMFKNTLWDIRIPEALWEM